MRQTNRPITHNNKKPRHARARGLTIALGVAAGLAACGTSTTTSKVIIQVGNSAITMTMLDHWMSVMAGGRSPSPGTQRYQVLRQNAAEFLISSEWAIGEAADRGVDVSDQETQRGIQAKERAAFPGGNAELQGFLKATGQTIADIQLEVKAALASSKLRRSIEKGAPRVTFAQVRAYYRRHWARFAVPEQREVRMTNRKTATAADEVKREVAAGRSFVTLSERDMFGIARNVAAEARTRPLEGAMASATPNVLVGPVKQRVDYFVFEVKRIIPATHEKLSRVENAIAKQLTEERRRRALAAFDAEWTAKWSAITDCHAGYVVAPCRQYRGPRQLQLGFGLQ